MEGSIAEDIKLKYESNLIFNTVPTLSMRSGVQ